MQQTREEAKAIFDSLEHYAVEGFNFATFRKMFIVW
jgi:hypothetical protein